MKWIIMAVLFIIIVLGIRNKKRGYFWKKKDGTQLKMKEFFKEWKNGIMESTPLQQTRISLFAFMPLFAGILWGMAVTFLGKTYWLTLILLGSLPLTSIQFLSTLQKYKAQKKIEETMRELNK